MKSFVKIIIGGGIAVFVATVIVLFMIQAVTEEKISKQQHPCYKLYIQLLEMRDEMVTARINSEMLNRFNELGNKWIVEYRCGENLEEWADEEIFSEVESFISPLNQSP